MKSKGEIILYKSGKDFRIDVKLQDETVWLTQKDMATLFNKDVRTINEHIKNIYKEKELTNVSTIRKFRIVQTEGNRKIKRTIDFYNLRCYYLCRLSCKIKTRDSIPNLGKQNIKRIFNKWLYLK